VHPDASYWTSACIDDDPGFEHYLHLYVSQSEWSPGRLDPLLRQVADGVIANALLADTAREWFFGGRRVADKQVRSVLRVDPVSYRRYTIPLVE
jgi:hypothetical protein